MSDAPVPTSERRKPPLTPRQAMLMSCGGLGIGVVVLGIACTLYSVPLWQGIMWFALGAFFLVGFSWAFLDWESRNRTVRAHNRFVYFTVAIVAVVLVAQWGTAGQSFPKWAIAAIVCAAIAAYSVMAYYAIANFLKLRNGQFRQKIDTEGT